MRRLNPTESQSKTMSPKKTSHTADMGALMTPANNLDMLVRESLRTKILGGDLEGGFHLSELKISKDYNVSRTPVREALCALAADGLVEMVPHRGAFVTHVPPHTKTDQLQAYGLYLGLAAKMAAEKANIEMLLDLENSFAFASEETMTPASQYGNTIVHALETVETIANSPTISESLGMLRRRASLNDVWQGQASQKQELNTQFTLLLAALKRKKADSAEKTMRQLVTLATNAWMMQRRASGKSATTSGENYAPMESATSNSTSKSGKTTAHA